jgi:coproporphyrinogen III oxidase
MKGGGEYRIIKNGKVFEKVGSKFFKSLWKISKKISKKYSWS